MATNVPMDNLSLSFTVEEWLDSNTAELTIDVDASVGVDDDDDSVDLRTEIREALTELVDVEWRFVRVNRHTDRTGREAWRVSAQARVDEGEITNLGVRTKEVGRVGLQFRVGLVDYSPTQEAVEELNRILRSKVNALVSKELEALNGESPGRDWRVASVSYDNNMSYSNARAGGNQPMIMAAMASKGGYDMELEDVGAEASGDSGGFGGFEVSQKVTFTANVIIASTVPESVF